MRQSQANRETDVMQDGVRRMPKKTICARCCLVFAFVALLSLGMAFIAPNLAALISKRGGEQQAGASLGVQNAANSLGQASGPLLGGLLFIWQINAPYLFSGAVLLSLALVIGWKALDRQREARLA